MLQLALSKQAEAYLPLLLGVLPKIKEGLLQTRPRQTGQGKREQAMVRPVNTPVVLDVV